MTTTPEKKITSPAHRRWWKFAAIAGTVLGAACHALPPHLQAPCHAVSQVISICTGH